MEKEGEDAYDWLRHWEQLGAWSKNLLSRPQAKVFCLRYGNSNMTMDLHTLRSTYQAHAHFLDIVIRAMEARCTHLNTV